MSTPETNLTDEQKKARRRAAASAGGRAVVAKYGAAHMAEIGAQGYFVTGSRYGFDYVNNLLFGVHLSKAIAQEVLQSRQPVIQPRFYLTDVAPAPGTN